MRFRPPLDEQIKKLRAEIDEFINSRAEEINGKTQAYRWPSFATLSLPEIRIASALSTWKLKSRMTDERAVGFSH